MSSLRVTHRYAVIHPWLLDLDQGEAVCYIALLLHARGDGEAFPHIRTLAQQLRVSESTVKRYLADLRDQGVILVESRLKENGSPTSNLYLLYTGRDAPKPGIIEASLESEDREDPGFMGEPTLGSSVNPPSPHGWTHHKLRSNPLYVSSTSPPEIKRARGPEKPSKLSLLDFLPETLSTLEVSEAWEEYRRHRAQLKVKPYTEVGLKRLASQIKDAGITARELVDLLHAIEGSNYQGIPPGFIKRIVAKRSAEPSRGVSASSEAQRLKDEAQRFMEGA